MGIRHDPRLPRPLVALVVLTVAGAAGAAAEHSDVPAGDAAHAFLRQIGLSGNELGDIDRRGAVSRTLPAADAREIATLGAVQIRVPAPFYIEQLRNIVEFKRSDAVRQIGTFSTPATVDDVAGLTLPRGEINKLQNCRVHDCNLQLSSDAIARFDAGVEWDGPNATIQANQVMREILVDLVNEYRTKGAEALMEYSDDRQPVSVAGEFEAMVTESPALLGHFPEIFRHVRHFPASPPAQGVENLFYWSKEKVGPAEVVSVTHMSFARVDARPVVSVVASKQIYGSHYFDASLGLTLLLHDPAVEGAGIYLVYMNRSRVNALGGFFGGVKRSVVRSRTRSTMATYLVHARDRVEGHFAENVKMTVQEAAAVRP